jgi:hypothetical protein
MLFLGLVTEWRDQRDSSNRVAPLDGAYREFILNTNRISDIIDESTLAIPKSRFNYSDNPADRREGLSMVRVLLSPAQLITLFDTSPFSQAITLRIHKHNNPAKDTVDTTIGVWSIAYVDRYNPDPDHHVWVIYYKGSFKRMEVLCNHGLEEFIDIIQSGSTSSTR